MRTRPRHHPLAAMLACVLLASTVVPAAAASRVSDAPAARWVEAAGTGGIAINGSATATRDPQVTVTIPAPASTAGAIRVSNDDGATWVERPWSTAFAWSLVDPAAGGADADGTKRVTIETGDGTGPWTPLGAAAILLDRTGPVAAMTVDQSDAGGPTAWVDVYGEDAGVGIARHEVSLDGVHWRGLADYDFYMPGFVDLREGTIGGSWLLGPRTVYGRLVDRLGNVGLATPQVLDVTFLVRARSEEVPAVFAFPKPAVTGALFTIDPEFLPGYAMEAGQTCQWTLRWGTPKVRLMAGYDETYGMVRFTVGQNAAHQCAPWTFTLPYSKTLEYSFSLGIMEASDASVYMIDPVPGSFRATLGTTERAITSSTLPLYYVLPDRDLVSRDGTVTYRLRTAGGASTDVKGWWWCEPAEHESGPSGYQPQDQYGGFTFTCQVTSAGPWVAMWTRETSERRWMAGYDPIGDRRAPVVTLLRAEVAPAAPSPTGIRARVRWSGYDKGTGLRRWELQSSRDGGAWRAVALADPKATWRDLSIAYGHAYRFRVRGVDRAGNRGTWSVVGPTRPARWDDGSGSVAYGSGWSVVSGDTVIGARVHAASTSGSWARLAFTGRSVAWVAPRGPGRGFAQVFVDGALAATVDLRAALDAPSTVVWRRSWASASGHTVRIRVLGTVGRPEIAVDGFVALR